jgi:hypothetical protein
MWIIVWRRDVDEKNKGPKLLKDVRTGLEPQEKCEVIKSMPKKRGNLYPKI